MARISRSWKIKKKSPPLALLPLGAMMLVGSFGMTPYVFAQGASESEKTLRPVIVKDKTEVDIAEGKNSVRATQTRIGKSKQELRDIPQSITVVTEKLMDDRNLDTMKEALKHTAGISFLAAEGGEEDIRLRGFSLQATGDVFVDGIRDPAFYERDTFNLDRLEVLRGSASMLFGRGSTGGAVNQVSKTPRLLDENQVDVTVGSHQYRRVVADMNAKTGDGAALRVTAMQTKATNNGAGSSLDKSGLAGAYRFGIGERDEFLFGISHLSNRNGMNYGMPWIRPTATSGVMDTTTLPIDPTAYYGMASDRNHGKAAHATFSHTHRFGQDSDLKTQVRFGKYERDQRAGTVRFAAAALQPGGVATTLATFGPNTVLTRGTQLKIQTMDTLNVQSDFTNKFEALGVKHELLMGADLATEKKIVYAARTAGAQGGVTLTKPVTTVGTPNDGAWVNEDSRVLRVNNQYVSTALGIYANDFIHMTPQWKLLGGLRHDTLRGDFDSFAAPTTATANGALTNFKMNVSELSKRVGALYQPNALHSYHMSYATSFNTSGDTYSLSAANADTPPEQSVNFELGAKLDSADKRFTTRLAFFHAIKKNERNTDPLLTANVLTGERFVRGIEADVAGRLTSKWEVFASYTWMPSAAVTKAAPCPATGTCVQNTPGDRVGDRPTLLPLYTGSFWNTYQVNSQWRLGAGLTLRGEQKPIRNEFHVPAFVVGDVMAEYTYSEGVTVKLNVSNVTNKLYADQLYAGHYIPGAGRLAQMTASIRF